MIPKDCGIGKGYWGNRNLVRNFHALGVLKLAFASPAAKRRQEAHDQFGVDTWFFV